DRDRPRHEEAPQRRPVEEPGAHEVDEKRYPDAETCKGEQKPESALARHTSRAWSHQRSLVAMAHSGRGRRGRLLRRHRPPRPRPRGGPPRPPAAHGELGGLAEASGKPCCRACPDDRDYAGHHTQNASCATRTALAMSVNVRFLAGRDGNPLPSTT